MRKLILIGIAATSACTVMVNGKPHRIGGGGSSSSGTASASGDAAAAPTGAIGGQPAAPGTAEVVAAGEPIKLRAGFTGPLIGPVVSVKFEDVRVYDAGYRTCDPGGGAFTTAQAPLSFELAEAMPELRLRLEGANGYSSGTGGVIIKPDGSYVCDDNHSEVFGNDWPKGTYKVLLYGQSIGGSAALRLDVPSRVKAAVDRAKAAVPTITLGADGATNPLWASVKPTVSAEAADIGMGCDKGKHDRVMPLAKLAVTSPSTWLIATPKQPLFVITPDQHCFDAGETRQLAAGSYELWTVVGHDGAAPPSIELELDDRARPLAFAAAETRDVGELTEPMTIAGTVRPPEQGPSRSFTCGGAARQPDFYLRSAKPLQKVALSILWGRVPQRVHVFGPIADMKPNSLVRCGERGDQDHSFDVFEGTYAVWVGGAAGAPGTPYHVLLRRIDVPIAPLTALAPIPTDLSLEERALKNHYPFFSGRNLTDWAAAFTEAPDQLFAYPRTAVKERDLEVAAGEPLLIQWSQHDGKTAAFRFDGSSVSIDTRLMSTDRPDPVVLPTRFTPRPVDSVSRAIEDSGPEDKLAVAAYQKVDDHYTTCLGNYLAKNDPTWGHSGDLYKISGSGRVTNVSDEIADRGARACGGTKLDAAGKKLMKTLAKTRAARYSAHLAAVRKRFGL